MTLENLVNILPGFVTLYIHGDAKGIKASAGEVRLHKDLSQAVVKKAIPLEAYAMEVILES